MGAACSRTRAHAQKSPGLILISVPRSFCGTLPAYGAPAFSGGTKIRGLGLLDPDHQGEILWQTKVGGGGVLGGIQWGATAHAHAVFAGISDIGIISAGEGFLPDPKVGGGWHAVALASGKKLWDAVPSAEGCNTTRCSPAQSAAVTSIPGVVFFWLRRRSRSRHIPAPMGNLMDYNSLQTFETVNKIMAQWWNDRRRGSCGRRWNVVRQFGLRLSGTRPAMCCWRLASNEKTPGARFKSTAFPRVRSINS